MSKIKYTVKENNRVGTHSFYAIPVPTGVLDFKELCEEACEDNTYSPEEMLGCVSRFMKTVQRETLRGFRCKLGEDFLTVYPNIEVSVKDHKDKEGNYFPDRYWVDTCINDNCQSEYFVEEGSVYEWLKNLTQGKISTKEDIEAFNEDTEKNENDYIYIHQFEVA